MAHEIERKYLVARLPTNFGDHAAQGLRQGYVAITEDGTEVRVRAAGDRFTLTIKSAGDRIRSEVDIPISREHFESLWPLTQGRRVDKHRTRCALGSLVAEVDIFHGHLEPLRLVEVEFESSAAANHFEAPDWFGLEVTEDPRYKNKNLAVHGIG